MEAALFPPTGSKRHYQTLDGMRGIAAFLVMIYHYFQTPAVHWLDNTFIAVDFFFILSGFVMMHAYGVRLAAGMPRLLYLGRRLIRIYPMMATGILLGCIALWAMPESGHSAGLSPELLGSTLLNLCFLPDLHSPTFSMNGQDYSNLLMPADNPLWSISLEMLASLAFVYLCHLSPRRLLGICLVTLGLIIADGVYYAHVEQTALLRLNVGWNSVNFLGGLPRVFYGFCCGMLLYHGRNLIDRQRWGILWRYQRVTTMVIYALWTACLLFPHVAHGLFFLLAITAGAPLLILWGSEAEPGTGALGKATRFLGWISYPLYCVHVPVEWGVTGLVSRIDLPPLLSGLPPQIFAVPASLVAAALLARLIDMPVRAWLNGKINRLAR